MSQFYVGETNGGGGGNSINAVIGDYPKSTNATPVANVLKTFGGDATFNDTVIHSNAGIMISTGLASPGGLNTMQAVLTNRGVQSVTTTDATETLILSFDMGDDWYLPDPTPQEATFSFNAQILGYNSTDSTGFVYFVRYGSVTDGALGTEIGIDVNDSMVPASQAGTSVDADTSGNLVRFFVTGLLGKTINWRILMTYFTTATPP